MNTLRPPRARPRRPLRPPPARIAAFVSLGGFASLGYLIFFVGMALYGLWVSLVSCALMGVGGFLEAEALWDSS